MKQKLLFLLVLLLTATTGAWAQEPVAKDIVVSPESGTNISDAIKDALGTNGDWALNITINLAKGGTYTVTESIVPSASITINGNDATIDASGLTTHFIKMRKTPSYDKVESRQYVVTTPSKIENVTITGLTKALFYDNGTEYVFKDFTFNNCLINYSEQGSLIISLAASMVINFTITNSTFYCKDKSKCTANCIAMSGKRPWQVTGFEDSEGKLLVDHNTFYNVAYKKQFFNTNTLKGQNKYKYEFYSNIFVNVSNKKIYGNMASNRNQLTAADKNTYLWDGTFFSETNLNGDEGLQTDPSFKDADNGDLTVGRSTDQYANKTGDPRWTSFKVKMADGTEDAENWTISPNPAEEGATVTATYSGEKKVKSVKAVKKATEPADKGHALSASAVGEIVGSDGKAYAVEDKDDLPSGVTAVAMVAYKSGSNGLAIQLNGNPVSMKWAQAKTYAEGLTAVSGGTWRLPSKADWQNMFVGCAVSGDATVPDADSEMDPIAGFQAKIAAAGITWKSGDYWTSTGDDSIAWMVGVNLEGSYASASFGEIPSSFAALNVLGCLAF